jgi:hypothetical protein
MSVEQVRHLIPDFEEVDWRDDNTPSTLFPDEVIQTYLDVNDGNVKRAAATAMRALAVSEAVISKVIKTEDLQTDGAKVARALLEAARDLEDEADRDDERDGWGAFEIVPFRPCPPNWGWRRTL